MGPLTPRRALAVLLTASVCAAPASAAPKRERADPAAEADVERLEIARDHFQRGEQLAREGKLEAALVEYELAEVAHPSASLTEAKQHLRDAIEARRAAAPRAAAPLAPAASSRRPLRRFIAPIVLAPLALGALVAGGALLGTVRADLDRLRDSCAPACPPAAVDPLRSREPAAYALLGIGGALLVGDVVAWAVLGARRERAIGTARFTVAPGLGAIAARGRF